MSQETDSDAESIRSDTNTIKSPESESKQFEDSLNPASSVSSTARTVSDSSDSNMSDAEVDIIHDYTNITDDNVKVDKAHKMYSRTMSSSYCQVQI